MPLIFLDHPQRREPGAAPDRPVPDRPVWPGNVRDRAHRGMEDPVHPDNEIIAKYEARSRAEPAP